MMQGKLKIYIITIICYEFCCLIAFVLISYVTKQESLFEKMEHEEKQSLVESTPELAVMSCTQQEI